MSRIVITVLTAMSLVACREPAPPDPRFVTDWLRTSLAVANAERLAPPAAARAAAYASVALYEGYAADRRTKLRSLAGRLNGLWSVPLAAREKPVDGATVAATAERVVLDSLFSEGSPSTKRAIDSVATAQIARRSSGVDAEMSARSVDHGRALGRAIVAWAATDGFFATRGRPWVAPKSVAQWINTAATNPPVVQAGEPRTTLPRLSQTQPIEPHWGTLRTFALRNGDECAPARPPVYSELRGSDFWKMGKELYDSASNLTPEKRETARFWADDPDARGFHWLSVVDQMIERRNLTADQAAEAYALTSVAMADAYIAAWRQKYRSMVVRPVTYVQRVFNPRWQTAFATPPSPEYPSAHSALSGAVVEVLVHLVGDTVAFTDSSRMSSGVPARAFPSLTHARDEAAVSRVYAGLHFVPSVVQGLSQGQCVGQRVLGRLKTR